MKLSDVKVKALKVPEGKSQIKVSDGGGLYVLVKPEGKYWKMGYRFAGKQKTLSIGVYPRVSLKEARAKRDAAHKLLDNSIDPSAHKKAVKRKLIEESLELTFESIAREYIQKNRSKWTDKYISNVQRRFELHVFPKIGKMRISEIEAPDVLRVVARLETEEKIETANRLKMLCGQVFRYAIALGHIRHDPTRDLQGAITPVVNTHRATITDPKKAGELMRAIDGFEGTFVVSCALRITPYVFLRPGELRQGEWSEIDFDSKQWRIPAEKMKMKVAHIVPLSKQVMAILKDLYSITGNGKYLFPSARSVHRPMSENTINVTLRRLGYDKDEMCAHGFRAMASTLLHEQAWNSDVIERQLAHKEGNAIKGAYNHARHLPERVKMMQEWADFLDGLRDGATIIPIHRSTG